MQDKPLEFQVWLKSNHHILIDSYVKYGVNYLNGEFNTTYQYTLTPNDKPSLLGHFMDVYAVSVTTAFSLFLITGIMVATFLPVSIVFVIATVLGALGGYILAKDIVEAGYRFFTWPKVASPTSRGPELSTAITKNPQEIAEIMPSLAAN